MVYALLPARNLIKSNIKATPRFVMPQFAKINTETLQAAAECFMHWQIHFWKKAALFSERLLTMTLLKLNTSPLMTKHNCTKYLSQNPHSFDWNEYEKTALHLKIKNTEVFKWSKNSLLERID